MFSIFFNWKGHFLKPLKSVHMKKKITAQRNKTGSYFQPKIRNPINRERFVWSFEWMDSGYICTIRGSGGYAEIESHGASISTSLQWSCQPKDWLLIATPYPPPPSIPWHPTPPPGNPYPPPRPLKQIKMSRLNPFASSKDVMTMFLTPYTQKYNQFSTHHFEIWIIVIVKFQFLISYSQKHNQFSTHHFEIWINVIVKFQFLIPYSQKHNQFSTHHFEIWINVIVKFPFLTSYSQKHNQFSKHHFEN